VRTATEADLDLVTRIMAEGFYDDPLMRWALDDDTTRLRTLTRMFQGLTAGTLGSRGVVHLAADVATALWWEPDLAHATEAPPAGDVDVTPSDAPAEAAAPAEPDDDPLWTPEEAARFDDLSAGQHEVHPSEPHWYLHVVSTLPEHRSRGFGAAVLAPVLAQADADGTPCYLESTNPRNRSLYRRLGFVDVAQVPYDGPDMLAMWREPRS
jgi:ribosomal protein S18 acetylase RimI-like enzyme